MSEKARGALFNVLGDIEDLKILDAFSGSGALSYEAVSRGARHAVALENDPSAQKVIARNIEQLGLGNSIDLIKASAGAWLKTAKQTAFDIVLLDPPYDNPQLNLLTQLADCVKDYGILVISLPPRSIFAPGVKFELLESKNYGDANLFFYRKLI